MVFFQSLVLSSLPFALWLLLSVALPLLLAAPTSNDQPDSCIDSESCSSRIRRVGTLTPLIDLFQSPEARELFKSWPQPHGSTTHYEHFLRLMVPWVTADLANPLRVTRRPIPLTWSEVDCANPKYSAILVGNRSHEENIIVDFVPFGYDLEKLELRFQETSEAVDLYVVYEAALTQSGMEKPVIFNRAVRNSERFKRWRHKIIYLYATKEQLADYLRDTLDTSDKGDPFALEQSMRIEMIKRFLRVSEKKVPLKHLIMKNIHRVIAIQNDADEIPTGEVLFHLKHCALQPSKRRIYLPCLTFKKNFHWLQRTHDMTCLHESSRRSQYGKVQTKPSRSQLVHYLWRPGPVIFYLSDMMKWGHTGRSHTSQELERHCFDHLSLGAAVHLSSVAEPIEYLFKRCGVIEQNYHGALSAQITQSASAGRLSPQILASETLKPWCLNSNPMTYAPQELARSSRNRSWSGGEALTKTDLNEDIRIWWRSIPWVVRYNPSSYPFLLPSVPLLLLQEDIHETISKQDTLIQSKSYQQEQIEEIQRSKHELVSLLDDVQWQMESGLTIWDFAERGFVNQSGDLKWKTLCVGKFNNSGY